MVWDTARLLDSILLMPCTVVMLSRNNLTWQKLCWQLCWQKFLSINMVFHFVKASCLFSANIVADILPTQNYLHTCISWNFNRRLPSKAKATPPPPSFLPSPLLSLQTVQAPLPPNTQTLFKQSVLYIAFSWILPSPLNRNFQWTPVTLKFFILNPIPSFKSN